MQAQLPADMIAIAIREPGGPEVLEPVRLPLPVPGAGQVLIRVAAAGVNRPDVVQRMGLYPPPPGASPLPGLEVAGEIVALGESIRVHGGTSGIRSEERRVGKECHISGRSRWSPYH